MQYSPLVFRKALKTSVFPYKFTVIREIPKTAPTFLKFETGLHFGGDSRHSMRLCCTHHRASPRYHAGNTRQIHMGNRDTGGWRRRSPPLHSRITHNYLFLLCMYFSCITICIAKCIANFRPVSSSKYLIRSANAPLFCLAAMIPKFQKDYKS